MYRSNLENSLLKRHGLKKQTRDVKPAQGTINTDVLENHADFSESLLGSYRSGHNGRNNPVADGRRHTAASTEEFQESVLTQMWDQTATAKLRVPKNARRLWDMVSNHCSVPGGRYTPNQAATLNRFLNDRENQDAASELYELRNSVVLPTQARRIRRMELEQALANSLTAITAALRAE